MPSCSTIPGGLGWQSSSEASTCPTDCEICTSIAQRNHFLTRFGDNMSQIDERILRHIKRYRITTNEILRSLLSLSPDSLKTIRKRLVARNCLASRPLGPGRRHYYQLTTKAATMLGEPPEVAKPLGLQALARAYAVLLFCCRSRRPRKRINREELREHYPEFVQANMTNQADYYLDDWGGEPRLARIVIDYGAEWHRTVKKCSDIVTDGLNRIHNFERYVAADAFRLTVLVGENEKKKALIAGFTEKPLPIRPPRVEVVPELTALLNPRAE